MSWPMLSVVNGFVCNSSCDVALAKRNVDPKNPRNDPVKGQELEEKKALATGRPLPEKKVQPLSELGPTAVDKARPGARIDLYV